MDHPKHTSTKTTHTFLTLHPVQLVRWLRVSAARIFALLVTEPTPFGLHDLALVWELVSKEFQIPSGIVINKSGRGDEIIEDFASEKKIPILMRVPLDRKIAEAYSKGALLVDAFPLYKDKFIDLYEKINAMSKERQPNP